MYTNVTPFYSSDAYSLWERGITLVKGVYLLNPVPKINRRTLRTFGNPTTTAILSQFSVPQNYEPAA